MCLSALWLTLRSKLKAYPDRTVHCRSEDLTKSCRDDVAVEQDQSLRRGHRATNLAAVAPSVATDVVSLQHQRDANRLRDNLLLEATSSIITAFDLKDGAVLHQNHRSRAYYGDRVPAGSGAAAAELAAAPVSARAASDGAVGTEHSSGAAHGDAVVAEGLVGGSPLEQLFEFEQDKLRLMMQELSVGVGRTWKGVLRVPARLAPDAVNDPMVAMVLGDPGPPQGSDGNSPAQPRALVSTDYGQLVSQSVVPSAGSDLPSREGVWKAAAAAPGTLPQHPSARQRRGYPHHPQAHQLMPLTDTGRWPSYSGSQALQPLGEGEEATWQREGRRQPGSRVEEWPDAGAPAAVEAMAAMAPHTAVGSSSSSPRRTFAPCVRYRPQSGVYSLAGSRPPSRIDVASRPLSSLDITSDRESGPTFGNGSARLLQAPGQGASWLAAKEPSGLLDPTANDASTQLEEVLLASGALATSVLAMMMNQNPIMARSLSIQQLSLGGGLHASLMKTSVCDLGQTSASGGGGMGGGIMSADDAAGGFWAGHHPVRANSSSAFRLSGVFGGGGGGSGAITTPLHTLTAAAPSRDQPSLDPGYGYSERMCSISNRLAFQPPHILAQPIAADGDGTPASSHAGVTTSGQLPRTSGRRPPAARLAAPLLSASTAPQRPLPMSSGGDGRGPVSCAPSASFTPVVSSSDNGRTAPCSCTDNGRLGPGELLAAPGSHTSRLSCSTSLALMRGLGVTDTASGDNMVLGSSSYTTEGSSAALLPYRYTDLLLPRWRPQVAASDEGQPPTPSVRRGAVESAAAHGQRAPEQLDGVSVLGGRAGARQHTPIPPDTIMFSNPSAGWSHFPPPGPSLELGCVASPFTPELALAATGAVAATTAATGTSAATAPAAAAAAAVAVAGAPSKPSSAAAGPALVSADSELAAWRARARLLAGIKPPEPPPVAATGEPTATRPEEGERAEAVRGSAAAVLCTTDAGSRLTAGDVAADAAEAEAGQAGRASPPGPDDVLGDHRSSPTANEAEYFVYATFQQSAHTASDQSQDPMPRGYSGSGTEERDSPETAALQAALTSAATLVDAAAARPTADLVDTAAVLCSTTSVDTNEPQLPSPPPPEQQEQHLVSAEDWRQQEQQLTLELYQRLQPAGLVSEQPPRAQPPQQSEGQQQQPPQQPEEQQQGIMPFAPASSAQAPEGSTQLLPNVSSATLCWHRVVATRAVDPVTGRDAIIVSQDDVSAKVVVERHLGMLFETEHRLLEQIYPGQILRHLADELVVSEQQAEQERARAAAARRATAAAGAAGRRRSGAGGGSGGGAAPLEQAPGTRVPKQRSSLGAFWSRPVVRDTVTSLATMHPQVTLLFADIKGFTPMCQEVEPRVVMSMLNDLFSRFDDLLDKYGVQKVETIGDAYFVAGGLTFDDVGHGIAGGGCGGTARELDHLSCDVSGAQRRSFEAQREAAAHAVNVIGFAKAMLAAARKVAMPTTGCPVQIRVGAHTGPVVSGLVGSRMPRLCLFGAAVAAAACMESTGTAGAVHISEATHRLLPVTDRVGCTPTAGVR